MTATPALLDPSAALDFMIAGDARFTLVSLKTGARYTYRISKAEDREGQRQKTWFVAYLTGSDNESDYTYLGILRNGTVALTAKSKLQEASAPVVAIRWTIALLAQDLAPPGVQIWHTGHCGRCGRTLTVPESVAAGYGPECFARMSN